MGSALPSPVLAIDFETFAKVIRVTRLNARFLAPLAFEDGPSLVGRIRGAWGRALTEIEAKGSNEAAAARDIFFGVQGGDQKPFCLAAEEASGTVRVSLSLFGAADQYRSVAFDALMLGLSEGEGLAMGDAPGSNRRPLRSLGADWTRREGVDSGVMRGAARLVFRTPFKIGPRDTFGATYSDIWISAAIRASSMARWSGLDLAPDLGRVRAMANALRYIADDLRPRRWDRWSSRNPGQRRAMLGMDGTLVMD